MTLLLDFTIRVSIVLLPALVALSLLRRQPAALRHAVLSAAIFSAALLPALSGVMPSWSLPRPPAPAPSVSSQIAAPEETRVPAGVTETPSGSKTSAIERILVVVWAAGLVGGLTFLTLGAIRLHKIAARATTVEGGPWRDLSVEIAKLYALPQRVRLLQSDRPSMLVTWGVWRPRLILPLGAGEWPQDRIRVVLCHEFAHVRRRDWIGQIAAELLRKVFWFHPLLWVACSRLRRESEHACDDAVLNFGTTGADYAAHLLELARILNKFDGGCSPVPAMARPSTLERRFAAMLNPNLNRTAIPKSALIIVAMAFLALSLPVAAFQLSVQNPGVRIYGTVVDASGARMPRVSVSMANPQTRTKDVTATDEAGNFALFGLPAGQYVLQASMAGFAEARADVAFRADQDIRQDIQLNVGALTEMVTVRAQRSVSLPPAPAPQRIRVGGNVQLARLTAQVKPVYPEALRDAGIEGSVTLEGIVGTNGNILSLRAVSADARPEFVQAATDAVSQWAYRPMLLNGVPVEVITTITVNFWLSR